MPKPASADRTDLHYTDTGAGPVFVFTHSWGMNSGQWADITARLVGRGFRCITYDRRGHGRSERYDGEWTVDLLPDDLAGLLEQLDLKDVTLVGHSLGCGEIVRCLSRHGIARVSSAVFVAPQLPLMAKRPDNPDGVEQELLDGMLADLERDVRKWCVDTAAPFFGVDHTVAPEVVEWTVNQVAEMPTQTLLATARMGATTDYRAELAELQLPVLLIHGDADVSTPIELAGRRTAELLPQAKLIEIPGAAHGLYVTHADRIVDELAEIAG